jgi:arylsulfatase
VLRRLWRHQDRFVQFNVSAYNMGMMGYETPTIDRLAKEGTVVTD